MEDNKKSKKSLIDYLEKLRTLASSGQPSSDLKKYNAYYFSDSERDVQDSGIHMPVTRMNMVKPIIDTKATLVIDQDLETEVNARDVSMSDFNNLNSIQDKALILNDCLKHVLNNNKIDDIKQDIAKGAGINGSAICKVHWDQPSDDMPGDIKIETIDPINFLPDPAASTISECNFIFVRKYESIFDLKKRFVKNPEVLEQINKLGKSHSADSTPSTSRQDGGVISFQNSKVTTTQYTTESSDSKINKNKNNILVWECYLKDDTIFVDPDSENSNDNQQLKEQQFVYPNGRVISYIVDNSIILNDKAIDYPFGFPFDVYSPLYSKNEIFGVSQIQDLMYLQDRLDRACNRVRDLIMKHNTVTLLPPESGIDPQSFNGKDIMQLDFGAAKEGAIPIHYTTNSLQDIAFMLEYIEKLKSYMMEISRINPTMLSGDRPVGVNSGRMVMDLMESPLTSVRDMQRRFSNFMISVSNKVVTLIQLYYRQSRIIRITTGEYIQFEPSQEGEMSINRVAMNEQDKTTELVNNIKGDLMLSQYEVKVVSGANLTRSKHQTAQLTMELAEQGFFGPLSDPDVKKFVLQKLDYPNFQGLMKKYEERMEEEQENQTEQDKLLSKFSSFDIKPKEVVDMIKGLPDELIVQKSEAILTILLSFGLLPHTENSLAAPTGPIPPSGTDFPPVV